MKKFSSLDDEKCAAIYARGQWWEGEEEKASMAFLHQGQEKKKKINL